MFKAVYSMNFVMELENRFSSMSGANIGACLKVPPEHAWWYYQENGTAPGYAIFPTAKKALAWTNPDGSHRVLAYVPEHPGVKAKHFVLDAIPDIQLEVIKQIGNLVLDFDAGQMQTVLVTEIMPVCKEIIIENVRTQLPGSREAGPGKGESAGKLGGSTAAEVLDAAITIEAI